jgi:hypothetical protein
MPKAKHVRAFGGYQLEETSVAVLLRCRGLSNSRDWSCLAFPFAERRGENFILLGWC